MLRIQSRNICQTVVKNAGVAGKGKSQGFSKAASTSKRPAPKRITPTTLYKNWVNTIHSSKLNRNATQVSGIPTFNPINMDSCINSVTHFSDKQTKALRYLGSFKKGQYNELFTKPISLIRKNSTEQLWKKLSTTGSQRVIITGESGIGKTSLLAQMHSCAVESDYIVVNISYPELFLNGRNDFFFDKNLKTYVQPMYLKSLIRKIIKANDENVLNSIKLSKDYNFVKTTLKGTDNINLSKGKNSLFDLLNVSINSNIRGEQFEGLINELFFQDKVPICFTVDNFSRMLTGAFSDYKDVNNKNIYLMELQMGKTIMDIVSNERKLNNKKSCVILAISGIDKTNRTLPVALGKIPADPYMKRNIYEPNFVDILQKGKVEEFEVPKLSREEAKKLIQYYIDAKIVLNRDVETKTLEQMTDEKYFMSGSGNPRELLKSIVLTHK
ncbi:similar to Saccharomyces cerevisiae YGL129C RSM23 Mitochondrial ribosomal protein of the small subunit, has similarity to mammalian apoptosis mediator proteins [Maudiozyma barnettii]|uniref:Small ribosomal subunit protein mS29 n=1 Tax=Maudiozyma barnettii TaxID=61262 RepID=A0A8H2ZH96_9SACH|nr:mitochondrial 37S ribosomal protein RSM23 [Kazachstania barnettii]CAB4254297.1 similar to Saccharomyces cerevisiae YGL129C RSM23 Mitochondrial ribosomal protein of the small subunit, has similarity to mammalian apoptosis mediator proteins [Kazachstania barnettii]CAD1782105.1 similar to Saccharomyces cerevisiae YGL129C RSM23 Mitochondrial ribosomal protein of the small subunit, has similarity to mammalian apoptosis mediator proteins [Kazachstania barnettii]